MIAIDRLVKTYGKHEVLRGIDLVVRDGLVTGIAGPNACGKTTLIKTILGLVVPDRGEIRIDGELTGGESGFRRKIGYMPQNPRFPVNLSLHELMTMLEDLRGEKSAVRHELVTYFSLNSCLDKPFGHLSGGTKQKAAAVIALLFDPPVVILDEPTAGLDPLSSVRFKDLVRRKSQEGKTIVLVSHLMSEVEQLATDIVFMSEGEIAFSGTVDSLRSKTGEADVERALARIFEDRAGSTR